jgi:hypothetical protein
MREVPVGRLPWPFMQFTVWETHGGAEGWTEEREKQNAQRKFVLLDTNSDNLLTPEVGAPRQSGGAAATAHPAGLVLCRRALKDSDPSVQELLPVFADLHPTESRYARMVSGVSPAVQPAVRLAWCKRSARLSERCQPCLSRGAAVCCCSKRST